MPPVDVTTQLIQYVTNIFSNRDDAVNFVTGAREDMAAEGITDHDLSNVDMRQVINQACTNANLPPATREALQGYTPASHPTVSDVVTQVTQATQIVYQSDEHITQIIDQHQEINVEGDMHGDITATNDPTNVMAGAGGTAVSEEGEGDANVASGPGSQVIGGDVHGDVSNLGAGAQQVTAGGDINAPIIGGDNSGIAAGGPVSNAVVGDHNQSAQVSGNAQDAVFNFGGGSVTDISAPVTHSAIGGAGGGDASNVSGNTVQGGSAISTGGDATGHYEDNDSTTDDHSVTTTTETEQHATTVHAEDSIVTTEDGYGDSSADHATNTQEELEPKEA